MPKAAIIFNGIRFNFSMMERAFSWARQNSGSLLALFLKSKHEVREGYVFPSDLDSAQDFRNNEDAEAGNMNVINANITILEHSARSENIELTTRLLNEPSDREVLQLVSGCQSVFIDEKFDQSGILRIEGMHLKKLLKKIELPIVKVAG